MFAYMMKLFWSKFGVILCSILQTVWTQFRLLRSSLISGHSVCLHNGIILEKILKCTEDIISSQHMYVDDLSLVKRLSHDVVQFLKWDIHFQVFSPHIFSWGFLFPCCIFIFFTPSLCLLHPNCGIDAIHCESALIQAHDMLEET